MRRPTAPRSPWWLGTLAGLAVAAATLLPGTPRAQPAEAAAATPAASSPPFALPASFAGVLPCADCPGVAQTLTLRADHVYRLRRTYLGRPDGPYSELGVWAVNAAGTMLMLRGADDTLLFAVQDDSTLRLLDRSGRPIDSAANLALRRTAELDPVDFADCDGGVRERPAAEPDSGQPAAAPCGR